MRRNNSQGRSMFTPQDKLMQIADKFGNTGIQKMQGSTVVKYDSLPLDGRTQYNFFEGSAQRNFPLSNTGSDGNRLGVGASMVIQRAYLSVVKIDPLTDAITQVLPITLAAFPAIAAGEFGFEVANSLVIKNVPIMSWLPEFNKNSENALNTSFEFDTLVSIQPLLEYVASIRVLGQPVVATNFLRLTIEGVGSIMAARTTM